MNENARSWITALRSGQYTQTRFGLKYIDHFDVMGVACDLYLRSTGGEWEVHRDDYYPDYRDGYYACCGHMSSLPTVVQEWLGLGSVTGEFIDSGGQATSLMDLNDQKGLSFAELADIIEAGPQGLFVVA